MVRRFRGAASSDRRLCVERRTVFGNDGDQFRGEPRRQLWLELWCGTSLGQGPSCCKRFGARACRSSLGRAVGHACCRAASLDCSELASGARAGCDARRGGCGPSASARDSPVLPARAAASAPGTRAARFQGLIA